MNCGGEIIPIRDSTSQFRDHLKQDILMLVCHTLLADYVDELWR
jgi:hypothetical protein